MRMTSIVDSFSGWNESDMKNLAALIELKGAVNAETLAYGFKWLSIPRSAPRPKLPVRTHGQRSARMSHALTRIPYVKRPRLKICLTALVST
jgi:hypothetical protein